MLDRVHLGGLILMLAGLAGYVLFRLIARKKEISDKLRTGISLGALAVTAAGAIWAIYG